MTQHIGVKLINAFPMTRQAYNDFRGWQLPAGENGEDEGYLVEYLDGGKPNTDRFDGYVSWSPKEVFEKAYRPVTSHTRSALRTHNPKSRLSLQVCSRRGSVFWRLKQHLDYMG